jgi:transcriptional regulator with XRE-family HTH domain
MIKEGRKAKGWEQAELAQLIGCHTTTLSTWERGLHAPGAIYIEKLQKTLGINISFVLIADIMTPSPETLHPSSRRSADILPLIRAIAGMEMKKFPLGKFHQLVAEYGELPRKSRSTRIPTLIASVMTSD